MLVSAIVAHVAKRPYIDPKLNTIEFLGLAAGMLTMYFGLFLFVNQNTDRSDHSVITGAATIAIFVLNIAWLIFCLYLLFSALILRILSRFGYEKEENLYIGNESSTTSSEVEKLPNAVPLESREVEMGVIMEEEKLEARSGDGKLTLSNPIFEIAVGDGSSDNPPLSPQRKVTKSSKSSGRTSTQVPSGDH